MFLSSINTVEPLTDTSEQRTPPNNGQIFSSHNTVKQGMTPPYSGHLSTTDIKIGPKDVRYMEVPLYLITNLTDLIFPIIDFWGLPAACLNRKTMVAKWKVNKNLTHKFRWRFQLHRNVTLSGTISPASNPRRENLLCIQMLCGDMHIGLFLLVRLRPNRLNYDE